MPTIDTNRIKEAVEMIKPILAGLSPEVQGAILADLMAIWLAGHYSDDPDDTRKLRAELLALHCQAVRNLIPINAKMMGIPE